MMGVKYSLEPSHIFLYMKVFMAMFTLTEALCPGLGQLQNGTTFFRYGGIYATFTCNPGFKLLGHVTNSCIRGKWRKPVPVCVANGCLLPTGILHGSMRTSHNNAAITFTCNKGYKLFGSEFIYCNGKRWNGSIAVCKESDMMGKTIAQLTSSDFMEKPSLSGKSTDDLHRIFYNRTQSKHHNYTIFGSNSTTIMRINDFQDKNSTYQHKVLLKFWENQNQLQMAPGDKLKLSHDYYSSVLSSKEETQTEPHNINITKWNPLPNKVPTGKQIIWTTFQTALKPHTEGPLVSKDPHPKTENDVTSRNALTSLLPGHVPYLKPTPPKVGATTRWKQSEGVFTGMSNSPQSHSIRKQSPSSHFLITFKESIISEATSSKSYSLKSTDEPPRHVTASGNSKYTTDYASTEKPIATSAILTSIRSSTINYTKIELSAFNQHVMKGNNEQYKYNKVIHNVTTKKPILKYISTSIASQPSERKASKTIHGMEERHVTTPSVPTYTHIPHKTKANRNQIYYGALRNALKRKVWCFYPPVPIHGTFRFLTLKDPLPNQYQYYIQYYCYPGYTMTQGDVHSYCMENGTWSGVTPICEDM